MKPHKELVENPDSHDIFIVDNVDDRYPNRPDHMEETSVMDFLRNYDVVTNTDITNRPGLLELKRNTGVMKLRKKKALISHFIPNKIDKKEEYFQSLLILFKPWRTRKEVIGASKSYEDAFKDFDCDEMKIMMPR